MPEDAAVEIASEQTHVDRFTLIALAVLVWAAADVLHELVAHGGTCVLLGGKALAFDTVHMACDGLSGWNERWLAAAGTIANFVTGALALLWHERRRGRGLFDYALWLFGVEGLFIGGGYLLASPLGHFGDWDVFTRGLSAELAWRIGLTVVGVLIYRRTMKLGARALERYLPSEPGARTARAKALTWIPYFTGGTLLFLGGLLNQVGWQLIFISAIAAGFFGPIGFFFLHFDVARTAPPATAAGDWPRWPGRRGLIALGAIVALAFLVIARGVPLS